MFYYNAGFEMTCVGGYGSSAATSTIYALVYYPSTNGFNLFRVVATSSTDASVYIMPFVNNEGGGNILTNGIFQSSTSAYYVATTKYFSLPGTYSFARGTVMSLDVTKSCFTTSQTEGAAIPLDALSSSTYY